MTKFVVSNSQVAHLWANQSQEHAHSGSMSFRGTKCYSYSTCIAALHHLAMRTDPVALLNSRTYSSTTSSRHMPAVRRALGGLNFVTFTVPEVSSYDGELLTERQHLLNQNYLETEYTTYAARLMRGMSLEPWHNEGLRSRATAAREYANAFDLQRPRIDTLQDWEAATQRRARLDSDPKRQAKIAARNADRLAREARTRLADELRNVEVLAGFRQGAAQGYWNLVDRDGAAYLRLSADRSTVQTSRGASVPADDARRAITFIRAIKMRGASWARNGETCPVGQFQIDRIAPNGDIHAGCHFIKWNEIATLMMSL